MIIATHKFSRNITVDGVPYLEGQEIGFEQISLYNAFMDKLEQAVLPSEDRGTDALIDIIKSKETACKELYYRVLSRQIKGGLLNQTLVKQRNIDTAMAPFMVPLYMGRVVGAIAGIAAVTAQTITNHTPFITANGLLKLRNELHEILNIPPANTYNE